MAKARSTLLHRVTPAHLQGIGRVAAEWSRAEIAMLDAIGRTSGVEPINVAIMAGPAAFLSWVDMLIVLCRESDDHKHKEKGFEAVCGLLTKLQRLRNYAVHAVFTEQKPPAGALAKILNPGLTSGKDKAHGFGIPKRGRDLMVFVYWTAPQMRLVARLISKAREVLLEICDLKKPTSPREQRALARTDRTNLRRIREMLDALPDPFRK